MVIGMGVPGIVIRIRAEMVSKATKKAILRPQISQRGLRRACVWVDKVNLRLNHESDEDKKGDLRSNIGGGQVKVSITLAFGDFGVLPHNQ